MLGHSHPASRATHDPCDRLGIEVAEHTEQDDLCVLGREERHDPVDRRLPFRLLERLLRRRSCTDDTAHRGRLDRVGASTGRRPPKVGEATPSDREHPGSKGIGRAVEGREATSHGHPDLSGEVVGVTGLDAAQESQHQRVQCPVHALDGCRVAATRRSDGCGVDPDAGRPARTVSAASLRWHTSSITDCGGENSPPAAGGTVDHMDLDITLRALVAGDLPAVCAIAQRCQRHDGVEQVAVLEEFEEEFDDEHVVFATDTLGATDPITGELVAYAYTYHLPSDVREERCYVFGGVDPRHRRRGIGTRLMEWGLERAATQLDTSTNDIPRYIRTDRPETDAGAAALFTAAGLEEIRYTDEMRRALDTALTPGQPVGVTVMPWPEGRDDDILDAKNAAFADHWGSTPTPAHAWRQMVSGPGARTDLSCIAVDADGAVIGHCLAKRFPDDDAVTHRREGWIDNLGVRREFRGRGVATALIAHSIDAMRADDLTHAVLMVDSANPTGAVGLYSGLGFTPVRRTIVHQRQHR